MSDDARRERAERYRKADAGEDVGNIPPALTPSEWAGKLVDRGAERPTIDADADSLTITHIRNFVEIRNVDDLAALIALANHALNDEDPRKITRARVDKLRQLAEDAAMESGDDWQDDAEVLHDLADTLESYLPPTA